MDLTFQVPMLFAAFNPASIISPIHNWVLFLAPSLHSFWSYFSTDLQQYLLTWGVPLSVSYLFAFSYCSWGSQSKNTEVVCHSLFPVDHILSDLSTMTRLSWVAKLNHMAWLSFTELDKAVVHVTRLASCL